VLRGTLRWEKERAEHLAVEAAEAARAQQRLRLDAEAAELEEQLKSLQVQIDAKRAEMAVLAHATHSGEETLSQGRSRMRELRGADTPAAGRKPGAA
jgi:peptidoglycan hydrolase CwlO-like protein